MAAPDSSLDRRLVRWGAGLGLVAAAGLGLLRFSNSGRLERDLEPVGTAALALVYASPALLALLSLRARADLLPAAIALGAVASLSAFSGVTLVLLVPTSLWSLAYLRALRAGHRPRPGALATGSLAVVLVVAGFFALFLRDDPACWKLDRGGRLTQVPNESGPGLGLTIGPDEDVVASGCTSDVITTAEGLVGAGLVGAGLVGSAALVRPPGREPEQLP